MDSLEVDNYEHVNEFIFYTSCNIPGRGCDLNLFESQISYFCSCKYDRCMDLNSCACLEKNGKNYENKKLIDTKLFGKGSCIECNSQCQCDVYNCENRLVQFGPSSNLKIQTFSGKGFGLITEYGIRKGHFVCEYAGEVIGKQEAIERRKGDSINYIFTLNEYGNDGVVETIVDATCIANIGRYINHSCDPNCVVIPVRVDSVIPKLGIFALKDVKAGEEITYSYNGSSNTGMVAVDLANSRKLCLCGSDLCSKYLPYNP